MIPTGAYSIQDPCRLTSVATVTIQYQSRALQRWGILVYKATHHNNDSIVWDGHANTGQHSGTLVDQGTYYYMLNPCGGLTTIGSYLQIIR